MTSGDSPAPVGNSRYLSATRAAQLIRAELEARFGWNRRAISVRASSYSLGSSIDVSILVPGIPLRRVERVAKAFERIRRDPRTGEILGGGNRYVGIKIEDQVLMPFLGPVHTRLQTLPPGPTDEYHPVRFGRYCFEIARTVDPFGEESFRLNGEKPAFYSPHQIGKTLARILAQSRQWHRLLALSASKEPQS